MTANELIKILENDGWYFVRQKGSHKTFKHDFKEKLVTVPDHGKKELGKGLVHSILKKAGLS